MTLYDARQMLKRWGGVAAFCGRKNREITDLQQHQATAAMGCSRPMSTGGGRSNLPGDPTHAAAVMIEQYAETIKSLQIAVAVELEFKRGIDSVIDGMDEVARDFLNLYYVRGWSTRYIARQRYYSRDTIRRKLDQAAYDLALQLSEPREIELTPDIAPNKST